jgi:hypothetical protein
MHMKIPAILRISLIPWAGSSFSPLISLHAYIHMYAYTYIHHTHAHANTCNFAHLPNYVRIYIHTYTTLMHMQIPAILRISLIPWAGTSADYFARQTSSERQDTRIQVADLAVCMYICMYVCVYVGRHFS